MSNLADINESEEWNIMDKIKQSTINIDHFAKIDKGVKLDDHSAFGSFQATDIKLKTSDGDTVTIAYGKSVTYAYSDYSELAKGKNPLGNLADVGKVTDSTGGFQMSVEGNINDEERKDIEALMGKLDKAMGFLLHGDLEQAQKLTSEIGAFRTIEKLDVDLIVSQGQMNPGTVEYSAYQERTATSVEDYTNYLSKVFEDLFDYSIKKHRDPAIFGHVLNNYYLSFLEDFTLSDRTGTPIDSHKILQESSFGRAIA